MFVCNTLWMSTLIAQVKIKTGFEDHWESIAKRVFTATHEHESGCIRYEYWRGTDERTYYVLLSFNSFEDFMTHQVAEYHHNTDFRDCFEDFKLEWVDPISGASPLKESSTSGVRDDQKGEVWNQYVENHSNETPDWWSVQREK